MNEDENVNEPASDVPEPASEEPKNDEGTGATPTEGAATPEPSEQPA